MGPLLNQQTSFHSNLLFRMGRLIEMELLKSLAAASQTAIQEELRIVWWVVDCLLWLVCLRGYGPWPAMALRERKTNKKSNQQSKEREWTNQLLLERPFSKEWMKWMSWWKKRKGVVFVNGAPRPAGRGKSNKFNSTFLSPAEARRKVNEFDWFLFFFSSCLVHWAAVSSL